MPRYNHPMDEHIPLGSTYQPPCNLTVVGDTTPNISGFTSVLINRVGRKGLDIWVPSEISPGFDFFPLPDSELEKA